jgi:hypothetical protein
MRAVAFGTVTIGLVATATWYLRSGTDTGAEPEPAPHDAKAPPAESAKVVPRSQEGAPAPLPGQVPVTPMAQLLESKKEQLPPELVEQEQAFSAEPVDAAWATGAEANVLAKLAQMSGLALTGLRVECRSTMCRLQMASTMSPDSARPPFDSIVGSIGLAPRWVMSVVDSQTLQSIAYLQRE